MTLELGALVPDQRERVREILTATAVFRPEEVEVAIELFDEATGGPRPGAPPADYEVVGAFVDAELAGYACYGPTPATDRTFDLYWIAMHPEHQGSGGGSRLLGEVERTLRDRGARLLVVETSSRGDYTPTRRFYEARGYTEAARLREFYAPADDRVIYTKRLAPSSSDVTRSNLDE